MEQSSSLEAKVYQLVKNLLYIDEHKGSLPCTKWPDTKPYPQSDQSTPPLLTVLPHGPF
jgi:hypothetical protein